MSIFMKNRSAAYLEPVPLHSREPAVAEPEPAPRRRHFIMRTLIYLVVLIAGVYFVLGYFRDWYTVSAERSTDDSNINLGMNVHLGKLKADAKSARDYVGGLFEKAKEENSENPK